MTVLASVAARTAEANADLTSIGTNATLTFYSGTRPATPDTAISGNLALAVFTWSGSAGTAANGVITFVNPPSATGTAAATSSGTNATWASIATSGGARVLDMDISTTGGSGDIQLATTLISTGLTLTDTGLTETEN